MNKSRQLFPERKGFLLLEGLRMSDSTSCWDPLYDMSIELEYRVCWDCHCD